jgi:NADH:ubiquinone oxidoreductase subunit E
MLPSERYRKPDSGAVLAALHSVNAQYGYLPEIGIRQAANELGVPLSQMIGAAAFYAIFSFTPCGRHRLQVCEGTACYVKGSAGLLSTLASEHGLLPEMTTDDQAFTLKRVRCLGSCALAPVMRVDNDTFGRVTPTDLTRIMDLYRQS